MNEEIKKLLEEWGTETVAKMILVLESPVPRFPSVATGTLRSSLRYIITDDGIGFLMEDYGKWVDEGTKPGRKAPPIAPLKQWVKLKGMPPGAEYKLLRWIEKN